MEVFMAKSTSNRIFHTPSAYAKSHFLYVQEIGTLQSLEPHISSRKNLNSFLFFVVLAGTGSLSYEGSQFALSTGDCVWIDCTRPYAHESSADAPWSLMWVHFNGVTAVSYYENYLRMDNPFFFHPRSIVPFTDVLQQLYVTEQTKTSLMELGANKYITDLITLCFTESGNNFTGDFSIPEKLKQIHTYIQENYARKIDLDSLTELFYISKYHLSREYKKVYGSTIVNDLTDCRISHAKSMLRFSEDSIESIAHQCGFQDAAYFIKVFKGAENMTPLQYRKKW